LGAAAKGLLTELAQENAMSGRLSVVLLVTPRLISMASNAIGGALAKPSHQQLAFLLSAAACLPVMLLAIWKPTGVFVNGNEVRARAVPAGIGRALKRLAAHRAIYLPAAIVFLWGFAPGWGTPLLFYLTNQVKLSEAVYGNTQAYIGGGTLIASLLYTLLCYRVRLTPLLIFGTFLGVLGCPIFLLIHNVQQAYVISFLAGASMGIALGAYNDLLIRCCPKELEGAALLFVGATSYIAGDTSDIFGSWLYEKGGFMLALAVSTLFTASIFLVLPFIPKNLTAPREGETPLGDPAAAEATATA
jgi:hypothetical protein